MATTLKAAHAYHNQIGLNISVYHVDPFWWSREPLGGCEEGAYAKNLSASPWHFPDGLAALGMPMMLFVQGYAADNVYRADYQFAGQSVSGKDSHRFHTDRFGQLVSGVSQCSALTLDGLDEVWLSDKSRYTTTHEQALYDAGLADAALAHGLPIRVDQEAPNDLLASVQYGARTVARCTYDANPVPNDGACEQTRFQQLGENSLFLRAVGVRPFTDDIWTTSPQGDPRWGPTAYRCSYVHVTIAASLSAGAVGFDDLINGTDASLLGRATRVSVGADVCVCVEGRGGGWRARATAALPTPRVLCTPAYARFSVRLSLLLPCSSTFRLHLRWTGPS
jgi:hypothetical protein